MKNFTTSFVVTAVCLVCAAAWGFAHAGLGGAAVAIYVAAVLGIMEVSLSFDNAVVNASVLRTWNAFWQRLFLSLGVLIAVFGMRLLFPLVIVATAGHLNIAEVWVMALHQPDQYAAQLASHHPQIAAFGGAFLLLVFLNFAIDDEKDVHWLGYIERPLSALGSISAVPILLALVAVMAASAMVEPDQAASVRTAGLWGVIVYLAVDVLGGLLENADAEEGESSAESAVALVKQGSIGAFLYIEVLDASFSFDGVIGAFAITNDIVLIMLGLAIGAAFVRSLTVYLVRLGALEEFVYLEHGAHYAIGLLAVIMLVSARYHIPDLFTGLIGIAFVGAALWASIVHKRQEAAAALPS
ncbi:MAG TPA: DUF475 domain-containing protein [Burkholderiaceae bacterium]|nr:DUF475 domain-containing protein [Burkholderiaceae bacterium]